MTTSFQSSPPPPPPHTGTPAADLADLLESYVFCARAEGKSPRTIDIRITSILALPDFLRAVGGPLPVVSARVPEPPSRRLRTRDGDGPFSVRLERRLA